jgi:hypothetical protein
VFGDAPRLKHLRAQWGKTISIVNASSAQFDATEAGVPNGGAILVRPDGFIGLRAVPANETTMAALDAHLATYLVPTFGASHEGPEAGDVRLLTGDDFGNRAAPGGVTAVNR